MRMRLGNALQCRTRCLVRIGIRTGIAIGLAASSLLACASHPSVLVPPRVSLAECGTIGMIELETQGDVDPATRAQASRQLIHSLQIAQSGVRVVELGTLDEVLRSVNRDRLDTDAVRAIAQRHGVDSVLSARLDIGAVQPRLRIGSSFESIDAKAELNGSLSARIRDSVGATLWTNSVQGQRTLAGVHVRPNGLYGGGAANRAEVESSLVEELVDGATDDFRPHYVRR